jgi:hypothetical protein
MDLPFDAMDSICSYCNYIDLLYLFHTCPIPKFYKRILFDRIHYIREYFPTPVIDLFSLQNLLTYPELRWRDTFIGGTGYIDHIRHQDMSDPIMTGVDKWKRVFIAIKTINDRDQINVDVLFQRYSDSDKIWACGTSRGGFSEPGMNVLYNHGLRENITRLLNGETDLEFPGFGKEEKTYTKYYKLKD